jgi:hypothetical protein
VDDDATSFDMFEELESETLSFARSLDEPRDILDNERTIFPLHDPEIWSNGREGIVSNFWFYVRDGLYDCGFPSIWETDESNISYEFEFEFYHFFFSHISEFSKVRSLTCTRREVCISESSTSSFAENEFLSRFCEVTDNVSLFGIGYESSNWHLDNSIWSARTMHFLCSSFFPFFCLDELGMTEFPESCLMGSSTEDDISSLSSITSVGSSFWDIFLLSPCYDAISAFSSFACEYDFVDEHG